MNDTFEAAHAAVASVGVRYVTFLSSVLNSGALAFQDIVAAVAGKKLRVLALSLSTNNVAPAVYQWRSGVTTVISRWTNNNTVSPVCWKFSPVGHFETAAGEALRLQTLTAGDTIVFGTIVYVEVG